MSYGLVHLFSGWDIGYYISLNHATLLYLQLLGWTSFRSVSNLTQGPLRRHGAADYSPQKGPNTLLDRTIGPRLHAALLRKGIGSMFAADS